MNVSITRKKMYFQRHLGFLEKSTLWLVICLIGNILGKVIIILAGVHDCLAFHSGSHSGRGQCSTQSLALTVRAYHGKVEQEERIDFHIGNLAGLQLGIYEG